MHYTLRQALVAHAVVPLSQYATMPHEQKTEQWKKHNEASIIPRKQPTQRGVLLVSTPLHTHTPHHFLNTLNGCASVFHTH